MSRSTPRKRGHARHSSASGHGPRPVQSDYESDAAHYIDSHPVPVPNPALFNRTNTDLNLSVLRRYLPSINSTLSIAANAVVYTFNPSLPGWDKTGIEGTYFLCMQDPAPGASSATPRACIFVLNRRGLENVILDLGDVADFEVVDEIYIFRLRGGEEDGSKVMGIWIHADKDDTRVMNAALITETLRHVRIAEEQNAVAGGGPAPQEELGPAMQAIGRRLSLSDLFGAQNGVKG
ncbi:Dcp1-like decapping family protein [Colletotrichum higginsianum]|uniref:Dcp1-like decapping family protein n=1 Tax=Colletotrichum higginsianum (strain IMI 349063) TaxID=759273 RepID=H1V3S0_COLHI|nr:Dcp1-like decapping family protein [Colletotrichum higginsianum IMI 349063]OBR04166.1 Dcp1-like decapping family protein [Colletotrichum higginsianum IMI 349063]GJD03467.1 DCP1-like decapping family protein [Colletotrichum higginsianum]CCF34872.1 Dcp1-like decapping family protein [Colletotrichum higginsianum]